MRGSYLSAPTCSVLCSCHSQEVDRLFPHLITVSKVQATWRWGGGVADASETQKIQSGVSSRDDRKGKNKRDVEQGRKGIFHISGSSTVYHLMQRKRVWRPVSPTFQKPSPSMKSGVRVCSENKPNSITAGAVTAAERLDKITQ